MENISFGLQTILNRMRPTEYISFEYKMKEELDDFKVEMKPNPKFIAPVLSVVRDYSPNEINEACYILVEAVGASGKTELTKSISCSLSCPILDLGRTKVVAGNSLTGLLYKRLDRRDSFSYIENISEGKSTLMIDALDEGYMKTNNQGYLDFLDDIISLNPQKECPIIMLGRYNAVELAANYLFENGAKFITLQIEPFTLNQAKEFIDKAVGSSALRYEAIYKDTRDYIIETINGFFKDQSSIKNHASERFIGYAPVLQSISAFFKENTNYHVVLNEMKAKNVKSVELIVDIIERILTRDRDEKVKPILLEKLLVDRTKDFKDKVLSVVYDYDEQCARVLYKVLNLPFPEISITDASFLTDYNKHMADWINEHPFIGKHRIANVVFESYVLARLTHIPKYSEAAYLYIKKFGISYMFALIYYAIYEFNDVDPEILPYIYDSFRELNNSVAYYKFGLEAIKQEGSVIDCNFEFEGSNDALMVYSGSVRYNVDSKLDFGSRLEYLNINVPLDFVISSKNIGVAAPSYIRCKNLTIESSEMTLYSHVNNRNFMFECDDIYIELKHEQYLQINGPGKTKNCLSIVCPFKPEYPLYDYWTSSDAKLQALTKEEITLYKKLRSIILEFRSHSKGELAKHYQRIDFVLGASTTGQKVITALKEKNMMFKDGHLYKLDSEVLSRELGLSYDDFRNYEMSDQVIRFLRSIK